MFKRLKHSVHAQVLTLSDTMMELILCLNDSNTVYMLKSLALSDIMMELILCLKDSNTVYMLKS